MTHVVQATVIFPPGKVFDGKYGPRQNIKVSLPDGSEKPIWHDAHTEPYASLKKNAVVFVLVDGDKLSLLDDQPSPAPAPPVAPPPAYPTHDYHQKPQLSREEQIDQFVVERADLMKFCFSQAERIGLTGEDRRSAAMTLFIEACRNFK